MMYDRNCNQFFILIGTDFMIYVFICVDALKTLIDGHVVQCSAVQLGVVVVFCWFYFLIIDCIMEKVRFSTAQSKTFSRKFSFLAQRNK